MNLCRHLKGHILDALPEVDAAVCVECCKVIREALGKYVHGIVADAAKDAVKAKRLAEDLSGGRPKPEGET